MDKQIKQILKGWIKDVCNYDDDSYEWYSIDTVIPTNVIKDILALNFKCFFNNKGEIAISKKQDR